MEKQYSYAIDPWLPATSADDLRIRLIELQPLEQQPRSAPIRCRVSWQTLTSCPSFKALSYTWGTDPPSSRVYIEDEFLPVTPSLEIALQHIRHSSEVITIWIDQISIHQQNNQEKNEQVANMNKIYGAASEVIVWLGPAADDSDELMDAWKHMGTRLVNWGLPEYLTDERLAEFSRVVSNVDPKNRATIEYNRMLYDFTEMFNEKLLKSFIAWQKRAWFTRVWVSSHDDLKDRFPLTPGA
jgi:hypothetical protein